MAKERIKFVNWNGKRAYRDDTLDKYRPYTIDNETFLALDSDFNGVPPNVELTKAYMIVEEPKYLDMCFAVETQDPTILKELAEEYP